MPHRTQTNWSERNNFYRKKTNRWSHPAAGSRSRFETRNKAVGLALYTQKEFRRVIYFLWLPWRFQEKCERKQQSSIQRSRGGERKGSQ